MADDVLITPASRKIEFKDASDNVDAIIQTDASGNLQITNTGGDISIGDTTSDVYIGDGTNNVDIVFEQNGEIRGETGVTVTLGATGATTNLAGTVQLGGTTITATGAELNYTDGVTSNIQTQLDAKLPLSGGTMTGALDFGSVTGRVITITGDSGLDSADASIYLGNATTNYGFDIEYEGSGSGNANALVITSTNLGNPKEVLRANQDGIARFPNGTVVTGDITVSGTVDGRDVATDGTKLDGIEAGATADQTASEIMTAIQTVDGSGSGLDADKVDGYNVSVVTSLPASPDANTIYYIT